MIFTLEWNVEFVSSSKILRSSSQASGLKFIIIYFEKQIDQNSGKKNQTNHNLKKYQERKAVKGVEK